MSIYLVDAAKNVMWSKRPVMLLVWRDVNIMHLTSLTKFFENLNSISNIFQEPHYLLIFTGSAAIYISLRSSQPVEKHEVPSLRFSTTGKTYLVKFELQHE